MTLTISQVTEWLVGNGYSKVDSRPAAGGGRIFQPPLVRHWHISDYPEHGCSFVSITPEQEVIDGADGGSYSDMSLHLRIENNRVVGADIGESYSGSAIAYAKQPPATTDELLNLLQAGREVFRQMVLAMPMETPVKGNEEIRAEVAEYLASNPQALQLFTTPEDSNLQL